MADVSGQETYVREGLFVRRSTGLIRDVSPLSATVFNIFTTAPGVGLAISVFWVLAIYPGAHMISAFWLSGLTALAIAVPFALLAMTMPRSGGDYILVSRSLGPAFGLASSMSITFASAFIGAFAALAFVTVGLVPGLATIGLISGNDSLISASTTLSSKNWTLVLSLGMLFIGLVLNGIRLRYAMRVQNISFLLGGLGLLVGLITMLTVSRGSFETKFNELAGAGNYQHVLDAAPGLRPGTSWADTVPALGGLAFLFLYSWWSANYGGEIQAARTRKTLLSMTASIPVYVILFTIMTVALYRMVGDHFVAAANTLAGTSDYPLSVPPYWYVFVAIATKSTVLAVFLVITFLAWFPVWTWLQICQPIRAFFAWSFDGILPAKAAYVSERTRTPLVALGVTGLLTACALVWAVYSANFFTVLSLAILLDMITIAFVGLGALVVPYYRPEIWRQSPMQKTVFGIPVLSIAGLGGFAAACFYIFVFFKYPALGIHDRRQGALIMASGILAGFALYFVARAVQAKRGVDIRLNYREIPPE
jgi:APA family basic amino acid/polyamine antiporter